VSLLIILQEVTVDYRIESLADVTQQPLLRSIWFPRCVFLSLFIYCPISSPYVPSFLKIERSSAVRDPLAIVCLSTRARFSRGWSMTTCSVWREHCVLQGNVRVYRSSYKSVDEVSSTASLESHLQYGSNKTSSSHRDERDLFVSKELFFISSLVSFKNTRILANRRG
jgi:hypothetical protein